jgi:hypothetical protein
LLSNGDKIEPYAQGGVMRSADLPGLVAGGLAGERCA